MNKSTFGVALLGSVAIAGGLPEQQRLQDELEFLQFATANNKSYTSTQELRMRERRFLENRDEVAALNAQHGGKATFETNQFSDLTPYELNNLLGLPSEPPANANADVHDFTHGGRRLAANGRALSDHNINWIDHMTPVKNQGGCGSCSCFSATSALEGVQSIKKSTSTGVFTPAVRLSEQQGLDCTDTSCSRGGWMQWYFDYAKVNGANTEEQYPYTAVDGAECKNDPSTAPTYVENVINVATAYYDEENATVENIRAALQDFGPLTFAAAAGHTMFFNYKSGVIDSTMGCPTSMDHAMVIVGYEMVGGEVIQEESYDHCDIITKEKIKERRRCRRPTKEERKNEVCTEGNPNNLEDADEFWFINKRGKGKCCYMEEFIKIKEKIDPKCEPEIIETVTDGMPVWIIQNSWGTGWGDGGFARIEAVDGQGVCAMNFWTQAVTAQ